MLWENQFCTGKMILRVKLARLPRTAFVSKYVLEYNIDPAINKVFMKPLLCKKPLPRQSTLTDGDADADGNGA